MRAGARLRGTVNVRSGEGRPLLLVGAAFAAVEVGRGLGEVAVDSIVVSRFGPDALPPLFIALGISSLVLTVTYGGAYARARSPAFFPVVLVALAGVLATGRLLAGGAGPAAAAAVWVAVYASGMLLVTIMWTIAGLVFNARQAKRTFPLLTAAAIAGSFAGLLGSGPLARLLGTENLVLGEAMCIAVAAALLLRARGAIRVPAAMAGRPSMADALGEGARVVLRSPFLRLIAIAYVLLAVLMFSVSYPFLAAMNAAFPVEEDLAAALGVFSAAVTASSFLVATLLANRIYARLGLATVALALPLVYLAGFGIWLVRFGLATAAGVRFAQQVTQRGLTNAAWSAFFGVIPAARRGQAMAFLDGVPGQLGTSLSGVLLVVAARMSTTQVFAMGIVTAAVCLIVVLRVRALYARTLVTTLSEGMEEQVLEGGAGLGSLARDPRVLAELVAASGATAPGERALVAELLGRVDAEPGRVALERLAEDADAGVRQAAVAALARHPEAAAREWVLVRALHDTAPGVRAAALHGLAGEAFASRHGAIAEAVAVLHDDPSPLVLAEVGIVHHRIGNDDDARRLVESLLGSDDAAARAAGLHAIAEGVPANRAVVAALLEDPAPRVRAAAVRATRDPHLLIERLADPAHEVRAAAADALAADPAAGPLLLATLRRGTGPAQTGALDALRTADETTRVELAGWARAEVERAARLREHRSVIEAARIDARPEAPAAGDPAARVSTAHGAVDELAGFLAHVLRQREAAIVERSLQALAVLGAPDASGLIRRCLSSGDLEVRAQAIEAIDVLGHPRLGRAVVALLEAEDPGAAGSLTSTLETLGLDGDPWVRALALRTLLAVLRRDTDAVEARAAADPSDIVQRVAAGPDGPAARPGAQSSRTEEEEPPPVPDARPTTGELDRMLLLRRVPLFAALAPEDLQRLASVATERRFEGDEALVVEGDVGEEMLVIVDGEVRVVHERDGEVQLLTRYGSGNHVGELAVLRAAPRAATVRADPPGVHALVIGGPALRAILRERPDAAMAMLATLADRIGRA